MTHSTEPQFIPRRNAGLLLTHTRGCATIMGGNAKRGKEAAALTGSGCTMIKAVELRKGRTIIYNGELSVVHEATHVAKGNKRSYMQAKIKNFKTGTISDVRFNVDERIEVPFVESKKYEFLYREGERFIVMDLETFDQIPISAEVVGDMVKWLKPNEQVTCDVYEGEMVSFSIPFTVALEVVDAPPVVKGATATNQLKEVVLETGAKVRVPPFIGTGTLVNVDTRTGEYIDRAK